MNLFDITQQACIRHEQMLQELSSARTGTGDEGQVDRSAFSDRWRPGFYWSFQRGFYRQGWDR